MGVREILGRYCIGANQMIQIWHLPAVTDHIRETVVLLDDQEHMAKGRCRSLRLRYSRWRLLPSCLYNVQGRRIRLRKKTAHEQRNSSRENDCWSLMLHRLVPPFCALSTLDRTNLRRGINNPPFSIGSSVALTECS